MKYCFVFVSAVVMLVFIVSIFFGGEGWSGGGVDIFCSEIWLGRVGVGGYDRGCFGVPRSVGPGQTSRAT